MTTKHEIEIPYLPEGWEAVAYRHIRSDDEYVLIEGEIRVACNVNKLYEQLIVKKKQPRRIVLEETGEFRQVDYGEYYFSPTHNSVSLWVAMHKSRLIAKIMNEIEHRRLRGDERVE